MDRNGEVMVRCDGARFGELAWCDLRSPYEVDGEVGTSEYFFNQESRNPSEGTIIIRCRKWRRPAHCNVRGKITEDGEIVRLNGVHNHRAEYGGHGEAVYSCRGDWLRDVRENPQVPSGRAVLKHRRGLPMHAGKQVVPEKHGRTARRQAGKSRPPQVRNRAQLHSAICSNSIPGYTISQDQEQLLSFQCASGTLVLTTRRQLDLLGQARMLHADATYKTVPRKLCKQLFTVHGNFGWQGHIELALCALMTEATAEAYQEVFQVLKQQTSPNILSTYMGDFDAAMRSAVRMEFPAARIYGCLFHFVQALIRRASAPKVGLAKDIRKPGKELKLFLAFCSLPLLPPAEIKPLFTELALEAVQTNFKFRAFVEYVEAYWLGTIGPESLSLFNAPCRTNNGVEAFNAKLKLLVRHHPSTWNLISVLNDLCHDSAINININGDGIRYISSRPSRDTVANDEMIKKAWGRLEQGILTPRQFIALVKYRHGGAAMRYGLSDKDGNLDSDVADDWQSWIDGNDSLQDHNYDIKSMRHPFGDHSYANFSDVPAEERTDPQTPPISEEMSGIIGKATRNPPGTVLGRVSGHLVHQRDIQTLEGLNWLNDVVMNAYLSLIVERSTKNTRLPKVYAFDTFFFPYIDADSQRDREYDIFAYDILLVPVFSKSHWCMASIDMRLKQINYMDSLGGRNDDCLKTLLKYLSDELAAKKGCHLNPDDWLLMNTLNLPRQQNGSDCGVFALKYADYVAQDATINFTQADMPYFRRRMQFEILQATILPTGYGGA